MLPVLWMFIKPLLSMMSFNSDTSLLTFCRDDFSISESELLKSPTITVLGVIL